MNEWVLTGITQAISFLIVAMDLGVLVDVYVTVLSWTNQIYAKALNLFFF